MANTYICAMCGNEYEFETPHEEAVKEMKDLWGEQMTVNQCDIVCDDCFQKIHPSKYPEQAEAAKRAVNVA